MSNDSNAQKSLMRRILAFRGTIESLEAELEILTRELDILMNGYPEVGDTLVYNGMSMVLVSTMPKCTWYCAETDIHVHIKRSNLESGYGLNEWELKEGVK